MEWGTWGPCSAGGGSSAIDSWQQSVYAPQRGQGQDSVACCSYTENEVATIHFWPQPTHVIVTRLTKHLTREGPRGTSDEPQDPLSKY
jgi:hypothetical protein